MKILRYILSKANPFNSLPRGGGLGWGLAMGLLLTACESRLDIVPKGKSTLATVEEQDMVLNQEYSLGNSPCMDLGFVAGESLGMMESVPEMMTNTNTLNHAYLCFDETVDRKTLTADDMRYAAAYKYINYMNTVIDKLPSATGDATRKPQLMAEARVMRAYMHWLMAVIHAEQYDAATAASKGGIAYVTEPDVMRHWEKLTLEDTYRHILDDCTDEVIDCLPADDGGNILRADQAFGCAVRAKVLMQMKRYAEALPYAQRALQLNGAIDDRTTIKQTGVWQLELTAPNNYVLIEGVGRICPTMETLSRETVALFEDGDYVRRYEGENGWSATAGSSYAGLDGTLVYFNWGGAQGNCWGITSDRMYYTAAECLIRTGHIDEGLALVNRIRSYRVEDAEPFAATTEAEAMALMQRAAWIENIGSYDNFFNRKRWNSEPAYARTVTRDLGEYGHYSLEPGSTLWVFPFPTSATKHNPNLTHNY